MSRPLSLATAAVLLLAGYAIPQRVAELQAQHAERAAALPANLEAGQ